MSWPGLFADVCRIEVIEGVAVTLIRIKEMRKLIHDINLVEGGFEQSRIELVSQV